MTVLLYFITVKHFVILYLRKVLCKYILLYLRFKRSVVDARRQPLANLVSIPLPCRSQLSPKKTWEGFIGGFFATVVFGIVVRYSITIDPWITVVWG